MISFFMTGGIIESLRAKEARMDAAERRGGNQVPVSFGKGYIKKTQMSSIRKAAQDHIAPPTSAGSIGYGKQYGTQLGKTVNIADLHSTQTHVAEANLDHSGLSNRNGRPIVVRENGKMLILDGHHRTQMAHNEGKTKIDVDFWDKDATPQDVHGNYARTEDEAKDASRYAIKGTPLHAKLQGEDKLSTAKSLEDAARGHDEQAAEARGRIAATQFEKYYKEKDEKTHTEEAASKRERAAKLKEAAAKHAQAAGGEWDEEKHPRDENGKFA